MRDTDADQGFSPDGLTESDIDALIAQVDAELAEMPAPTSALLDGTARTRWSRRKVEHRLDGMVRRLGMYGPVLGSAGTAA